MDDTVGMFVYEHGSATPRWRSFEEIDAQIAFDELHQYDEFEPDPFMDDVDVPWNVDNKL